MQELPKYLPQMLDMGIPTLGQEEEGGKIVKRIYCAAIVPSAFEFKNYNINPIFKVNCLKIRRRRYSFCSPLVEILCI